MQILLMDSDRLLAEIELPACLPLAHAGMTRHVSPFPVGFPWLEVRFMFGCGTDQTLEEGKTEAGCAAQSGAAS